MTVENEKKEFKPDKNSRICAVHFTEDCFIENLAIRRFPVLISKGMLCRLLFFFSCSEKKSRGRMPSEAQRPPCSFGFC